MMDDIDDNTRSSVPASSNTTASATVVTASESTSCGVCRNAPRDKLPYYRVDMQRLVSSVLTLVANS